jgi:FtsP/CotA-like multicopper oxidase with cupredoxin domain
MSITRLFQCGLAALLLSVATLPAVAQSFRVQCPFSTITHPLVSPLTGTPYTDANGNTINNDYEPPYVGPTTFATVPVTKDANGKMVGGYVVPSGNINGAIKCQQIAGGDGFATMADGTQVYLFSFGPLSDLAKMVAGQDGTDFPNVFNQVYTGPPLQPGDPATTDEAAGTSPIGPNPAFTYNGAVGLVPDNSGTVVDPATGQTVNCALPGSATNPLCLTGHVDPRQIEDVGVMDGNMPAPLFALDEDDEYFLTLSNTGMIMRPDLFEQHTVHFHGYPNASSFYDGVPEASIAINIGGSFTYYYIAPDAGTYMWHCHITPPEHLQMGMVGQVYVRPRQNRVPLGTDLYTSLGWQEADPRTACKTNAAATDDATAASRDILCTNPLPAGVGGNSGDDGVTQVMDAHTSPERPYRYAYNDGDGSTKYDVAYPINIHGFDPNFHFIAMTFNAEPFVDMKDKYFLLNGRGYPDTVKPGPMKTQSPDGRTHYSQLLPTIINIPAGGRALLRISDLDVYEYQTLASLGIPMTVVGWSAKLLRDEAGHNRSYKTNSITIGGGESLDLILDASDSGKYPPGSTYFLYTPNLDHLSNDEENFGGLMTEVHICPTTINPTTRTCT